MIEKDNNTLKAYTGPLSRTLREEYTIGEEYYRGDVKRGLRNSDGTGVLVGVSKVGSVQGYLIQDGQRIPAPGRLYYRGIDLYDIVGAHREAGTFGYEEVAYLLLMGYLPSRPELDHFKDIMNQARKLPKEGDSVLILGANGKSGVLCGYEAMKKVGPNGNVVGVVRNPKQVDALMELGVYHKVIVASATEPVAVLDNALAANDGKEYDLSICCVNIENCEMSAILPVRDDGLVYFFSMATSFTKAALGAEGVGKDVTMIVGNGYTKNHAEITLNVLRENPKLRKLFDEKYC